MIVEYGILDKVHKAEVHIFFRYFYLHTINGN